VLKLKPEQIDYVNAHATGTIQGDLAEALAMQEVFKSKLALSSLKGHLGHTLGACGALETALTIWMMHNDWIAPNRNLKQPMLEAEQLDLVMEEGRRSELLYCMKNTFAFGGINTSLILNLDRRIERQLKSSDKIHIPSATG
jgi:3-oxoacyl-[acyl-carrier-protein] synthase II